MKLPPVWFSFRLTVGDYELDLNAGKTKAPPSEPPIFDDKRAADLGAPQGFGLLLRPDHIDAE